MSGLSTTRLLGTYFQDAGFTPDFPRSAELMAARWEEFTSGPELDGVLSLDPVAMSYLLEGTGPVTVGRPGADLGERGGGLLSRPYLELDPVQQDEVFKEAASAIFEAATGDLADPVAFVKGLGRAADEGRFLVASFDEAEDQAWPAPASAERSPATTEPRRTSTSASTTAPARKMSYYLRYNAEVRARSCFTR